MRAQELPRLSADHPLRSGLTADAPLIRALTGETPARTPVWFMRQAGRSLPEYREARRGVGMLDACLTPELAAELTLQPVRRHGVDAGIFFSDIVVPLRLAGVDVEIVPGRGPVMGSPVRTAADVRALPPLDPERLDVIARAVRLAVGELGDTPLIGFAGAPFTLAAYLVEGGPSKDHLRARAMMHADPAAWSELLSWAAELTGAFLAAQIAAGASAGQLFDSWAGSLAPKDYRGQVAWASSLALGPARELGVPLIHFGLVSPELLAAFAQVGVAAVGVDWRTPLDEAARIVGDGVSLQGNLDPAVLPAPWSVLEPAIDDVLRRGRAARGHVFNLGHGVPPETDPAVLTRIVEYVHASTEVA